MSTPMFQQYERIKSRHRDAIVLFRLGDFYEMFGADARDGARILGLTLTHRQHMPMCGVPHHAARSYIHKLLHSGRKVAICEQTSTPDGKGITDRDVVEVLSPGAVFDLDYLDPRVSNFIVAMCRIDAHVAVGWCDISTGELEIAAYPVDDAPGTADGIVSRELARLAPREILVQESLLESTRALSRLLTDEGSVVVNRLPDWAFHREQSLRRLTELFAVRTLRGFGVEDDDPALAPAGALIDYLQDNARHVLGHISRLRRHVDATTVILDDATIRNLELTRNMHDGGAGYTLIEVLDECATAMGSRLLRRRILAPARDVAEITTRLDRVEELYHDQTRLQSLRRDLARAHDLERLVGRLGVDKAHPKDVLAIASTLSAAATVFAAIPGWYRQNPEEEETLASLERTIRETLADEPAVALNEGGIIRPGFDRDLDELRQVRTESRRILNEYLEEQRKATGVSSLKIKYNRVLGHFFEVPASQAARLPEAFIRRQSLANAERFTTTRLGELEDRINSAGESADEREQELFFALRRTAAQAIPLLTTLAGRLAEVDVAAAMAYVATIRGYRRPRLVDEALLEIVGGRHPVVEMHLPPGEFVDNDVTLHPDGMRFALITGPNMAGKSTVLRQTALITLLAHVGAFVPAEEARIGLVDRIFCRVGASDNIARGESTFLVEMNETSNILRNATDRSLVIMDEVGRGTSTHDGLAIAWAVTEYLLNDARCRTLFATHYHELASLRHPGFAALGMAVEHSATSLVFLKKLRPGGGDRSYGVDVARMAGLPETVVDRARTILAGLEGGSFPQGGLSGVAGGEEGGEAAVPGAATHGAAASGATGTASTTPGAAPPAPPRPDGLFDPLELLHSELLSVEPDTLTPRQALDLIYRWKNDLKRDG
jgi:DNA mismatch repair protein MutS